MCRVSYFCCGCSLRSAAITAAVLNALYLLGAVISTAQVFVLANTIENDEPPSGGLASFFDIAKHGRSEGTEFYQQEWDEKKRDRETFALYLRVGGGICLFVAIVALIILISLCVGIAKNKAGLIMPWLIAYMIKIVLLGLGIIAFTIVLFYYGIIVLACQIAFDIYLWIVVLNYYRELKGSSGYQPTIVYKA